MYRLTLVRHLPTIYNSRGIFQGRIDNAIDSALITSCMKQEALNLSKRLCSYSKIYSSPLLRCLQTAAFVDPSLDPLIDNRLIEFDFGALQGLAKDSMPEKQLYLWLNFFTEVDLGESFHQFSSRINHFLLDNCKVGDHHLIFGHGVVIRYLIALSNSIDLNKINQICLPNFSVIDLQISI
jgi:alpha-ribazole phosphatase